MVFRNIQGKRYKGSRGSFVVIHDPSTSYTPYQSDSFNFSNTSVSSLESSSNIIRTVFDISSLGPVSTSSSGSGLNISWDVSASFPGTGAFAERTEFRETDNSGSNDPNVGDTHMYEFIFDMNDYPSVMEAPCTIMQFFDQGAGSPMWNLLLTGVNQSLGTPSALQTYLDTNNSRTSTSIMLVSPGINIIRAVVYFDSLLGRISWIHNGVIIGSEINVDTMPNGGGSNLQFGIYPHGYQDDATSRLNQVANGNGVTFDFTAKSYLKEYYTGFVPASYFL